MTTIRLPRSPLQVFVKFSFGYLVILVAGVSVVVIGRVLCFESVIVGIKSTILLHLDCRHDIDYVMWTTTTIVTRIPAMGADHGVEDAYIFVLQP